MDDRAHRLLISAGRPEGIGAQTRLGRIIGRMDCVTVAYRLWIEAGESHGLAGWGELRVESADGLLRCRVVGEVFRPSPVEYGFHSFWLTRRGMILGVANLLEERAPQARSPQETFIQPIQPFDRQLKAEAASWLKRAVGRGKGTVSS